MGAENPAVPTPITVAGTGSSARAAALPVLMVQTGVDQPGWWVGNPDASLSADGRGSDVAVWRGRDYRDGCVDSDNLLRALHIAGRAGRNVCCSSGCRDRSSYRSVRRCGNQRTGSVFRVCPLAVRANGVSARDTCVMTYFVRNVVPGRRGLRGAASELAWRLVPMSRLRFHRPVSFLPHPQHICRASLARRRLLRNPSAGCPAGSKP